MKGTFHVADLMCKWIDSGGPVTGENDPQGYYKPVAMMTSLFCRNNYIRIPSSCRSTIHEDTIHEEAGGREGEIADEG